METRREFIKKATLLSGMAGMNSLIPASVQRALAIDPASGSTWKDAEHIVILMQENRSFDHSYGTLQGVRGFNDPRAIQLPNGNPVWLQSNYAGETYSPFRLHFKDTKATWMNSLPHSWENQVNARNDGKFDQWLNVKRNSIKEYSNMPLTLGYYNREDIPFYYELADGFTICDQHFCSALTGTNPNRLYFWSGTIRADQNENSKAHVWNEDMDYETLSWKTFPEILEENEISWKFYQNEVSIDVGFKDEEDPWLSNFQDNPLEFFSQYNIRLHDKHMIQVRKLMDSIPLEIGALQKQLENIPAGDPQAKKIQKDLAERKKALDETILEIKNYNQEKFDSLSGRDQNLHRRAFVTNVNDPSYHSLEDVNYEDDGIRRNFKLPKGDLLHQFREDVKTGKLPTVSWLAAPENLSDHPSSAWYGAWYVSELMDILTHNPEVWKKTIFILTYDENDGYFDHVPPFVAPHSGKPETGKASGGMDTSVEYVTLEQTKERKGHTSFFLRESPIGLGYRVPMVVASPWSRGGFVNSEVFDLTSTLQFLETFLSHKTGKSIRDPNISDWRRSVCGDLTSIFRNSSDEKSAGMEFVAKAAFMESVYSAKFKKLPSDFKALTPEEIRQFRADPYSSHLMVEQEKGIRPSNGINYQLYADGQLNADGGIFDIRFEASNKIFGNLALGAPFNVYAPGNYLQKVNGNDTFKAVRTWAFAVKSSDQLEYSWPINEFENDIYHLRVYGPNGFYREFKGSPKDPNVNLKCDYQVSDNGVIRLTGNVKLIMQNRTANPLHLEISDNAYKNPSVKIILEPSDSASVKSFVPFDLQKHYGWYDFTLRINGLEVFERRYAGRVETGKPGYSDPFMGRVV
jgi:phospholipase C